MAFSRKKSILSIKNITFQCLFFCDNNRFLQIVFFCFLAMTSVHCFPSRISQKKIPQKVFLFWKILVKVLLQFFTLFGVELKIQYSNHFNVQVLPSALQKLDFKLHINSLSCKHIRVSVSYSLRSRAFSFWITLGNS